MNPKSAIQNPKFCCSLAFLVAQGIRKEGEGVKKKLLLQLTLSHRFSIQLLAISHQLRYNDVSLMEVKHDQSNPRFESCGLEANEVLHYAQQTLARGR